MPELPFPWRGFSLPTYTQVPDEFLDVLAPHLTEAELRVCLYVIRRTFGFKKASDAISVSQLVKGITTKDGRVLDAGTGMSRSAVQRGVNGLVEKGVLAKRQVQSDNGEYETNVYALVFAEPQGVALEKGHPGPAKGIPPPLRSSQTVEVALLEGHGVALLEGIQETVEQQTERDLSNSPRVEIRLPKDDVETIALYARDAARLLHDQAPAKSTVTRAVNLYAKSGLDLDTFLGHLQTAKQVTQLHSGGIKREAPDQPAGTKAKVPYFFEVLERLVGAKERE